MEHKKIQVPADVLIGLEVIRLSGKTNMLDAPSVIELALEMGHEEAAFWVYENRRLYAQGVFQGFATVTSPDKCHTSRHVAQHGASGRVVGKSSQERDLFNACEGGEKPCADR